MFDGVMDISVGSVHAARGTSCVIKRRKEESNVYHILMRDLLLIRIFFTPVDTYL